MSGDLSLKGIKIVSLTDNIEVARRGINIKRNSAHEYRSVLSQPFEDTQLRQALMGRFLPISTPAQVRDVTWIEMHSLPRPDPFYPKYGNERLPPLRDFTSCSTQTRW